MNPLIRPRNILIEFVTVAFLTIGLIASSSAADYPPNPGEGGGGTAIENEDSNVIHYGILTRTKTVSINLKNKYEAKIADVDLKVFKKVNGKLVGRYISLDSVALDARAFGLVKTRYMIKEGQVIRVSVEGNPIVYVKVKLKDSMKPGE